MAVAKTWPFFKAHPLGVAIFNVLFIALCFTLMTHTARSWKKL